MACRIALVGHCGVDGPRLAEEVQNVLDSAEVLNCGDEQAVRSACEEGVDLLLLNRELAFGFEERSGVELLRRIKEKHPDVKVILVSDKEEVQEEAKQAGALPGFGKADLGSDKLQRALRSAVAQ